MARIAIVEDNPDNRLLLQALLDEHELFEYETGQKALDGMKRDVPDLVLMDISLPEMDGTEVLARMKQQENLRGVPAIALTAHAMAGDRERLLAAGFDDYVMKPIVDEEVLYAAIGKLLQQS